MSIDGWRVVGELPVVARAVGTLLPTAVLAAALLGPAVFSAWPAAFAMDQVRHQTRTNDAEAKHGVTGRGVTVAILDGGIDWANPDFRNSDGTTRIKWLLDMSAQTTGQCPGTPAAIEYSEVDINAAIAGGPPVPDDFSGHGSASAGIAAGNGAALPGRQYRGMASDADLVIVKFQGEGAPAHGEIPAEPRFFGCFDDALNWIDAKIRALGQPAVGLANIEDRFGPVDGTSAWSRKIDEIFGLNRPGRVWVASEGDQGGLPNRAGGTYDSTTDTVVRFRKKTGDPGVAMLWYVGDPAKATITFDDGITVGPVEPGQVQERDGISASHYLPGREPYPMTSTSGDSLVLINTAGHAGDGTIRISALGFGSGRFDLYGDPRGRDVNISFLDHLVPGRSSDLASTRSAVVIGDHVGRVTYVDVDGVPRGPLPNADPVGSLWPGSADPGTRIGSAPVDVTAPGENSFASLGRNSYSAAFRENLVLDGAGHYVRSFATSGAAPIGAGAVALILQRNPVIPAYLVKNLLQNSAMLDSFTGPYQSADWGHGKLDVLGALDLVDADAAQIMYLALNANKRDFAIGERIQLDLTVNPGVTPTVDAYFGAFLPPGTGPLFGCPADDGLFLAADDFTRFVITCLSAQPPNIPPLAQNVVLAAGSPATVTRDFFAFAWPASAPAGTYTFFTAFTFAGFLDVVGNAVDSVTLGAVQEGSLPPNPPPTDSAPIAITRWRWSGGYDDVNPNNEFIELTLDSRFAPGGVFDLTGVELGNNEGDRFTFPDGAVIRDGQPVRVYTGSGVNSPTMLFWDLGRGVWNDTGDCIRLAVPNNGVYRVGYGRSDVCG